MSESMTPEHRRHTGPIKDELELSRATVLAEADILVRQLDSYLALMSEWIESVEPQQDDDDGESL